MNAVFLLRILLVESFCFSNYLFTLRNHTRTHQVQVSSVAPITVLSLVVLNWTGFSPAKARQTHQKESQNGSHSRMC
jgi:hypothetical protein